MAKEKDIHIPISQEHFDKLNKLSKQDRRKKTEVITIALENYFRLRQV